LAIGYYNSSEGGRTTSEIFHTDLNH